MKQLTPSVYVVTTGEIVTIVATPVKIAPEMVRAREGGKNLDNIDDDTPTFQFDITQPANSAQIAKILCNFATLPNDDTEGRLCRLKVSGSKTPGDIFTGPTIKESDSLHAINLNFLVDDDKQSLHTIASAIK